MTTFLGEQLWPELQRLCADRRPKVVAVPYYSSGDTLAPGAGDILIVDAEESTIAGGQTSAAVLLDAHDRGARVYSHSNLHAKIVLFGDVAVVSSANISLRSKQLREAGAVFTEVAALRAIKGYLDVLRDEAVPLSRRDLQRLKLVPVAARTYAQPSLFEALSLDLPVLSKLAFGIAGGTPDLKNHQVQAAVMDLGWSVPRGATWFESANEPGVQARIEDLCQGRPLVTFRMTFGVDGEARRFRSMEDQARPFLYAFTLGDYVVSVFGARWRGPSVDLKRDAKELLRLLNSGLRVASPQLRRRLCNHEGMMRVEDLRRLYKLGANAA